jgi:hypothetical protein
MQILLKLFLLLINVNEESNLDFLENENSIIDLESTLQNGKMGIEQASVSASISLQSLKSVFQSLIDYYKVEGLGLYDIENVILFITFVRFIILLTKYNLKTAFYISCISFGAALIWYFHIREIHVWYEDMLLENRLTSLIPKNLMNAGDQTYYVGDEFEIPDDVDFNLLNFPDFLKQDPIDFIKETVVQATQKNGHRIDPISMIISSIPEKLKPDVDKYYYLIFGNILPKAWEYFDTQFRDLLPLIFYLVVVRLGKRYCPYLIRWHWTFMFVNTFIEIEFVKLTYRLWTYQNFVLIPEERYNESADVEMLYLTIITLHYLFNFFGLLHALCGQYFYVPFIVENTEIHIGKRPINSIYSGGFTSWQNGDNKWLTKTNSRFLFPRLWWGWLGKNDRTQQKRLKVKRNKSLKKFLKKLKKWILRN